MKDKIEKTVQSSVERYKNEMITKIGHTTIIVSRKAIYLSVQ